MPARCTPSRRALLRATVALATLPIVHRLPAAGVDGRYEFAVKLGRSTIGRQSLVARQEGDTLVLRHSRMLRVKILAFEAYREQHDSEEHWRDGRLVRLRSRSEKSGERQEVDGDASGDGFDLRFRVDGETPGRLLLPAEIGTTNAFWTTSVLQRRQLIDSTDGDRVAASFRFVGEESVDATPTRHFALSAGNTEAEVWFADDVMWRALFRHDGHEVDYRRETTSADG